MTVDLTLDITTAAHRHLASFGCVLAHPHTPDPLVKHQTPLTDLLGFDAAYPTYIFRWHCHRVMEGTGKAAIVLSQRPGGGANIHNTMRSPRLQIEIFVDPARDAKANPTTVVGTAEDRCWKIYLTLDKYLHTTPEGGDPEGGERLWGDLGSGGLRVLGSQRDQDIDISHVPEGDGMVRGLVSYEMSLG